MLDSKDSLVCLEQGPWTDKDVETQFALLLTSGKSHQSDTKVQTWVSCHVGSIHLHVPSAQLARTLQYYVGNMKDDVLACFILILDEDRTRKQGSKQRNNG